MENILEETRFIMKKYNIRANKNLGQNFLINEEVVKNIVGCSNIEKEDLVIEIGPGLGTLTKYLKSRKSNMYRTRHKNVTNTRRQILIIQ